MTTQEQRDKWRLLRNQGMTSAIGEYTPSEFWNLLDDIETLLKENNFQKDLVEKYKKDYYQLKDDIANTTIVVKIKEKRGWL